ncbi:MAG: bifunctional 3-deoxy-7-phosphoheptulonate synthase/chorismate mutase [Bacilli bacterium]
MYEKVKEYNYDPLIKNDEFLIIAGPCAVEDEDNLLKTARFLISRGIKYMRGGAFKPRTSPYTFQGLHVEGLEILKKVKEKTGIKVVVEIMDISQIPYYVENIDIIQVGARNMQNFSLLKALGKTNKPILLKRGFGSTIDEWLFATEYILNEGNPNIILCERGIRTFEPMTRNTLDISSVPIINGITKIPVMIDPSHSSGRSDLILPLSNAAAAVGASGIMVEIHDDPNFALSDKDETIDFNTFDELLDSVKTIVNAMKKKTI